MKTLLKFAFSLGLIGTILWKLGGVGGIGRLISGMSPSYVALILLVSTADRALMTFKWVRLLGSRGMHLPFVSTMKIYCASMVWGAVLPTTVGADAIRAVGIVRRGYDANEVVSSIIIERMIGFLSALVWSLISLLLLALLGVLDERLAPLWWAAIAMLFGGTIFLGASFSQAIFNFVYHRLLHSFSNNLILRRLRELHQSYLCYRDNKIDLLRFSGLTFVEQLFPILFAWLVAQSMNIEVGFFFMAGAIPLCILISRIPVGVDGIGVFEGAFVLLMSLSSVSATEAVAIAIAGRVLQLGSWSPWWLAYALETKQITAPRAGEAEPAAQQGEKQTLAISPD